MKLKSIKIVSLIIASLLGLGALTTTPVFADPDDPIDICQNNDIPAPVREANGCNNVAENKLPTVVQSILNVVIGLTGIVAVIFIIIGGIQYMTSTGDATKIQKAKNTILYAVIGLAVVILAFIIVNWTIETVWNSTNEATEVTVEIDT